MIIKPRDAEQRTIEALEWQAYRAKDTVTRTACTGAAARLRADPTTEQAVQFIDQHFADSDDWAVIHDLRLRVGSRALQLNHVLVSSCLEIVCVDTRFLNYGLRFHDTDKCDAYTPYESWSVSSPLNKMSRDVRILSEHIVENELLPRRFGFGPRAMVHGSVLTAPAMRIDGKKLENRDGVSVHPSDALFPLLWKRRMRWSQTRFELLSPDALEAFTQHLAASHQPTFTPSLLDRCDLINDKTANLIANCA